MCHFRPLALSMVDLDLYLVNVPKSPFPIYASPSRKLETQALTYTLRFKGKK